MKVLVLEFCVFSLFNHTQNWSFIHFHFWIKRQSTWRNMMAPSQICSALNLIMHIFIHYCHYLNMSYFKNVCQEFLYCGLYFGYRTWKHTSTFMCSFSNAQHTFNFHLSMFDVAVNCRGYWVVTSWYQRWQDYSDCT